MILHFVKWVIICLSKRSYRLFHVNGFIDLIGPYTKCSWYCGCSTWWWASSACDWHNGSARTWWWMCLWTSCNGERARKSFIWFFCLTLNVKSTHIMFGGYTHLPRYLLLSIVRNFKMTFQYSNAEYFRSFYSFIFAILRRLSKVLCFTSATKDNRRTTLWCPLCLLHKENLLSCRITVT